MDDSRTTVAVQRYLDELAGVTGDDPAEPVVRALMARAVDRLHAQCANLLYRQYPRLMRGPLNLRSEEMLGGVVERLMKALRGVRPGTVRQFFALANQHMRWELNDLARRLDEQAGAAELRDSFAQAADGSPASQGGPTLQRILSAIDGLPEDEREVFNLVKVQGMTGAEAATVIGCSLKTVQRRLSRGLIRLAGGLDDLVPRDGAPGQPTDA